MGKRIAVVGSGAVGGYLGGHLARTGNDVTLIDSWPEHIETIRARGLHLSGMTDEETYTVQVPTMHITEVQRLSKERPIDIAIISSKSYDTEWCTVLIRPYLSAQGYVVSAQNSINEETIARVRAAGQQPMDAIIGTTSLAAEAIGLGEQIGSLVPGYEADIIAVRGDPVKTIESVRDVFFVMKGGTVYKK